MADASNRAGGRSYADELRGRIDRGEAHDKVNYPDPAAAPLGADDEAAGTTPTGAQVRRALEQETGRFQDPADGPGASRAVIEGGPAYALLGVIVAGVLLMLFFAITHIR